MNKKINEKPLIPSFQTSSPNFFFIPPFQSDFFHPPLLHLLPPPPTPPPSGYAKFQMVHPAFNKWGSDYAIGINILDLKYGSIPAIIGLLIT